MKRLSTTSDTTVEAIIYHIRRRDMKTICHTLGLKYMIDLTTIAEICFVRQF